MIKVRRARADEFNKVMAFYTQVIDDMKGTDFDVMWEHGKHPSPDFLRQSTQAGQVVIAIEELSPSDGEASVCAGDGADDATRDGVAAVSVDAADDAADGGVADAVVNGEVADQRTLRELPKEYDGRIVAAMVINDEGAPGYDSVPWRVDAALGEYGVIHVVATLAQLHGRGLGYRLLCGGIELARQQGKKALRLDTFVFNHRSHGLYRKCGFYSLGDFAVTYSNTFGTRELKMFELDLTQ